MTTEKWLVHPGETRIIDIASADALKVGLVGGQIDIVAHDEPSIRIEVHTVTVKDLRIEARDGRVEIDHPQLRWDNFLEVFRNFGAGGPKAEISVAVPRAIAVTLGVVSASALVAGLEHATHVNTVSGDVLVDGLVGDLDANAVSGDIHARGVQGKFGANSVSGDVAVTGHLTKVNVDTVSGDTLVDAFGPVGEISTNTVSGATTIRLDQGYPANFVARSAAGRVRVDGAAVSGSGPANYVDSVGELSGAFVDVRANSVSGAITVLRRTPAEPSAAQTDAEVAQ